MIKVCDLFFGDLVATTHVLNFPGELDPTFESNIRIFAAWDLLEEEDSSSSGFGEVPVLFTNECMENRVTCLFQWKHCGNEDHPDADDSIVFDTPRYPSLPHPPICLLGAALLLALN
jgi:hypothetical protein